VQAFDGKPGELTELDALVAYRKFSASCPDAAQNRCAAGLIMDNDFCGLSRSHSVFYLIAFDHHRRPTRTGRRTEQFDGRLIDSRGRGQAAQGSAMAVGERDPIPAI
jgi:hypothetical protein